MSDNGHFDQFTLPDNDPPVPVAKPTEGEDKISKLEAQLAEMRAAQDAERRSNQELMARMFAGSPAQQPVARQQPQVAIDLDGLPDPRDDYEGYHRGLAERLGKTMTDMRTAVRDELNNEQQETATTKDLFDRAWNRFSERHEDLAKFPELVESATAQVFSDLRQTGVDPMRLMQLNLDDVIDRVGGRVQEYVSRIRGNPDTETNPEAGGRTQMLDGASPKPRGRQAEPAARPSDFLDSLKKLQAEQRIY